MQQLKKARGKMLAKPVHDLSLTAGRSIVLEVIHHQELASLAEDHLVERTAAFLADPRKTGWASAKSTGRIRDIDWRLCRRVLRDDFVYFGSSRMIELLVGGYDHQADHCMAAKWRPAQKRPFYADAVYQASVVSWRSRSNKSIIRKARHFRSTVANANGQLPLDMPGVISPRHAGRDSYWGRIVERPFGGRRPPHPQLAGEPRFRADRQPFAMGVRQLLRTRSHHTAKRELGRERVMVPYKIGRHYTAEPLPTHLLLTPEGDRRAGVHWDGLTGAF